MVWDLRGSEVNDLGTSDATVYVMKSMDELATVLATIGTGVDVMVLS